MCKVKWVTSTEVPTYRINIKKIKQKKKEKVG